MSKKYDLGQLDKRVVDAFESKSKLDFMLWARKELLPLELAEVAHDAITGLFVVAPAVKEVVKPVETVAPVEVTETPIEAPLPPSGPEQSVDDKPEPKKSSRKKKTRSEK